jgi:hypothetical protein
MTPRELEQAERSMQQQWLDLVMAEQQGEPLGTLEQMYDNYILLAEEYNRCQDAYEEQLRQLQTRPQGHKKARRSSSEEQQDMRLAS